MRPFKFLIALLVLTLPAAALGGVDDLPSTTTWYFHADLEEMRKSDAGRGIFDWLSKEVFEEVQEEKKQLAPAAPQPGAHCVEGDAPRALQTTDPGSFPGRDRPDCAAGSAGR